MGIKRNASNRFSERDYFTIISNLLLHKDGVMDEIKPAVRHVIEALQAAAAEVDGNEELAEHIMAETRLRLIGMNDDELRDLAAIFAILRGKPFDECYRQFKQSVEEHRATASEWINDLMKGQILDREESYDR